MAPTAVKMTDNTRMRYDTVGIAEQEVGGYTDTQWINSNDSEENPVDHVQVQFSPALSTVLGQPPCPLWWILPNW